MTTLTVYFASSHTSSSSSSSSSNPSITTTLESTSTSQSTTKPIPIPTSISNSTDLPNPPSPKEKTLARRTSSKRNKTFFERFDQATSSTLNSNSQSPPNQTQATTDSSNPSNDAPPRLRRRLTFRRSFRHSAHNKGGEIDDGIRSVL